MSAEMICDRVTDTICRRIEADFGKELGVSASLDKLSLEQCSQFISVSERTSPEKMTMFADIDVNCRRSGVGEYETTVQAEMSPVGLTEQDLVRLSIELNVLKKYRALEPTVTTTTTQRVSKALAALIAEGGGGSEQHPLLAHVRKMRRGSEGNEVFLDRRVNISFTVAKLTTELKDVIAGGEAFDEVGKAASERVSALRQIRDSAESRLDGYPDADAV
jgi:hypothetical protein